jgi:hypothetical protein
MDMDALLYVEASGDAQHDTASVFLIQYIAALSQNVVVALLRGKRTATPKRIL